MKSCSKHPGMVHKYYGDSCPQCRIDAAQKSWADILANEASMPEADMVNEPPHYKAHPSGVECITITEHMGFNLGNAVKYIWRADEKGHAIEDLEKAAWYLKREIERRTAKPDPRQSVFPEFDAQRHVDDAKVYRGVGTQQEVGTGSGGMRTRVCSLHGLYNGDDCPKCPTAG